MFQNSSRAQNLNRVLRSFIVVAVLFYFFGTSHAQVRLISNPINLNDASTRGVNSDVDSAIPKDSPSSHPAETTAPAVIPIETKKSVTTTVQVHAPIDTIEVNEGYERRISSHEVEESAGTFGDPARFMQLLPGVVTDNDERNDFIVRGGNPAETLFIVDNIEMPSINHLALSDTTGGFVSMLDNTAIQQTVLHTDAYDSRFDQRLSAVVEISTRPESPVSPHIDSEFGIGGMGTSVERPLGPDGSMFVSVRRSVLNWFTKDVGMNGVPIYNNGLVRADGRKDSRNSWWALSLTGIDSIHIHPDPGDGDETNPFDIQYSGWRNTTGINWQHVFSAKSFGVVSASNSEQQQTSDETDQLLNSAQAYYENSHDGVSTVKYDWTFSANHWLTLTGGGQASADRMNYDVQQPIPLPNPYSIDPTPVVTMSVNRVFTPVSSAAYGQAVIDLPHGMRIVAGERLAQWAITGSVIPTGKAVFFAPIHGRMFHLGYAQYAQLPPSLYLLSFANQHALSPIRSHQLTTGIDIVDTAHFKFTANAYQKRYSDYPVSITFPQLSMANIADTFGQAFLMFPMSSQGTGVARGVETSINWRPYRCLTLSDTTTYMRSWYSGLDGVLRKGNFDIPLVENVSGNATLTKRWSVSFRYSQSTGKPYTPDNMELSWAQDRDVYNLSQLNSVRAPMYSRLDFRGEWTRPIGRGLLITHVGLENALGRKNFYSYQWMPHFEPNGWTLQQDQMPIFPDFGFRYSY